MSVPMIPKTSARTDPPDGKSVSGRVARTPWLTIRAIVVAVENNDLMRRIRYAVQLDDGDAARLATLGGLTATTEQATAWRAREDEPGYAACPDEAVAALLDGFVLERRGPRPGPPRAAPPAPFSNNRVLKQLRIALELQAEDMQEIVVAGGGRLGKGELGALFRKPGTRNYRACGDQVLRWFLAGLAARREPRRPRREP